MLRSLPSPSEAHFEAVTRVVEKIYEEQALTDEEITRRHTLAEDVSKLIHEKIPGRSGGTETAINSQID